MAINWGKLDQLVAQTDTQGGGQPTLNLKNLDLLIARTQPGGMPPVVDRRKVMQDISVDVDSMTSEVLGGIKQYERSAELQEFQEQPTSMFERAARSPVLPDTSPKSVLGEAMSPFKKFVTDKLLDDPSASGEFKRTVANISTIADPAEREAALEQLQIDYKKRRYEEAMAPVNEYYADRLRQEHSEEKHSGYVADFVDNWASFKMGPGFFIYGQAIKRNDTALQKAAEWEDALLRGGSRILSAGARAIGAKDWARAYYLASQAPEIAPSVDQDWADKALNITGETVPYMVASAAAAYATGGSAAALGADASVTQAFGLIGSGAVSFGVEGNSAYQNAIDHNVEEATARQIGFEVGLFAAAIESIGGGGAKYAGLTEKKYLNKLRTLRKWSVDHVKKALAEAFEEAGQEVAQIGGESRYRNVNGTEIVDRIMTAGAAGFALGGAFSLALDQSTVDGMREAEQTATIPTSKGTGEPLHATPVRERIGAGPETVGDTDEGTLHVLGLLRDAGILPDDQVTISKKVRTLADDVKEGHISDTDAIQMIKDSGLDPETKPEQVEILGRNFRDKANRAIVNLYRGHDATTVLHEVAEDYYRTAYGHEADVENITALRKEYEEKTGDYREGNNREWLADLATDYAVHGKIHERTGSKLRKVFDKFRDVYMQLLARVRNLRNNLREGNVPVELQKILEEPFAPTQEVTRRKAPEATPTGLTPEQQSLRARSKKLAKQHVRWFREWQKAPTKKLQNQIYTTIRRYNELLGLDADEGRPFVPPELGDPAMEIEMATAPMYKLSAAEQKLTEKFKSSLNAPVGKAYILSDGKFVAIEKDHDIAAKDAGTSMHALVRTGSMRLTREGSALGVELGKEPMSNEQTEALEAWMVRNWESGSHIFFDQSGNYDMAVLDMRSSAPSVAAAFQKKSEGSTPLAVAYKLKRSPDSPATSGQKGMGHVIPELLKWNEEQRRGEMAFVTGKTSLADMTYREADEFIAHMSEKAKEKGIRLDGVKTFGDVLAAQINHYSKIRSDHSEFSKPNVIKDLVRSLETGVARYDNTLGRMERLIRAMGDYEEGTLYNKAYREIREAQDAGEVRCLDNERFVQQAFLTELSPEELKAATSYRAEEVVKGRFLNPAQRIGIFVLSLNEDGLRHITKGNGLTAQEVSKIKKWMNDYRPGEVRLAEVLLQFYKDQFKEFDAAHFLATGTHLKEVDVYGPLLVQNAEIEKQPDPLRMLLEREMDDAGKMRIGETEERNPMASQAVELDAFKQFLFNNRRISRYIEMAPQIASTARLLQNRNLRKALNNALYGEGLKLYTRWLEHTTRGYVPDHHTFLPNTIKAVARNASVFAIGAKVTSGLMTLLSGFNAMATSPLMIPMAVKNMMQYPIFTAAYRNMEADVYSKSNMMKGRNWDRIVSVLREGLLGKGGRLQQKRIGKKMAGKLTYTEDLFRWIRLNDRHTTVFAWKSAYDVARAAGADEKAAVRSADQVVERTQPMGSMADLPDLFRSGDMMQILTRFKNQVNNNYNFWRHDIYGVTKAGKLGKADAAYRVFMSYVVPALLIGLIRTGRLPEDPKELAKNMVLYPFSGLAIIGDAMVALMQGYDPGSNIAVTPLTALGRARQEFVTMNESVKKETKDKHRTQGILYVGEAIGSLTGTVPQQAFVTARGVKDIASGETADPRRLIWSKSALKQNEVNGPSSKRQIRPKGKVR